MPFVVSEYKDVGVVEIIRAALRDVDVVFSGCVADVQFRNPHVATPSTPDA